MKAVRVRKELAEEVRRLAEKMGVKDKKRLVVSKGDFVEIPIIDGGEIYFQNLEIIEQTDLAKIEGRSLKDLLDLPEEKVSQINYKVLGELILVKIPEELEDRKNEIGNALLKLHKNCKAVWLDRGKEGMLRKPKVELIAGSGSETIYKENGCIFKFDVRKVMFSSGNKGERMRIAKIVNEGEVVVDMFAGIGYFSIPIAVHSKAEKIYSIEVNPDSYYYLLENINLNNVTNVNPILGDSMFVTPRNVADRVIMGHIYCQDFLPAAIRALRGKGYIHYHEAVPRHLTWRAEDRVKRACARMGRKVQIISTRKVKNYSPNVYHVVVDAYVY
ncbi:MAG: class I SAM-dependent methyltransferase family protein [Archaeoglobales archaeon]|nr:class I SAM-dependent methyltransferase family protein [Archaeoglobales archaeon]